MKPINISTFQPRLRVLNRDQAMLIHSAALEILEKIGFKMEHPGALELLVSAGAKVSNGNWVKLPAHIIEESLKSSTKQVVLYDQKGNESMLLTDGNCYYGTGSDANFTFDLKSGKVPGSKILKTSSDPR